jgi:hypothetical protein
MPLGVVHHLQANWPLVLAALLLAAYLPIVLVGGVFYTNQGSIPRTRQPELYWRWVRRMIGLLLVSLIVLAGSYASGPRG